MNKIVILILITANIISCANKPLNNSDKCQDPLSYLSEKFPQSEKKIKQYKENFNLTSEQVFPFYLLREGNKPLTPPPRLPISIKQFKRIKHTIFQYGTDLQKFICSRSNTSNSTKSIKTICPSLGLYSWAYYKKQRNISAVESRYLFITVLTSKYISAEKKDYPKMSKAINDFYKDLNCKLNLNLTDIALTK